MGMMRKFLYRLLLTSFLMIRQNFEINIQIIKSYYRNALTLAFNLTYAFYTSSTFFQSQNQMLNKKLSYL